MKRLAQWLHHYRVAARRYWLASWWHKCVVVVVIFVLACLLGMFGIAKWYAWSERNVPLTYGVSFIPDYASYLGTDPQQTMDALIHDVGVRNFRLVSYWNDIEKLPGQYDFSQLDWQFKKAEAAHAHIILTIGLRQPRWPECHAPSWVDTSQPQAQWQPQLETFMQKVVERYKSSPALQSYQLENEYFLKGFGTCTDFSRSRLVSEYNLVKQADPYHPIIVGRSNNALGFPVGQPTPDEFSISVYKRVWDAGVTHRYLEYPWPAWFYGFLAGTQKIYTDKDMVIGELQTEAWPPNGQTIPATSLAEQNKSLNADRLQGRFDYSKATGMKQIYFWGGEYWYYRKAILHDPSLWKVAKANFQASEVSN